MRKDVVPERFRDEFRMELSRLFWFRTNLFSYITILAFLAVGCLAFFFFKGMFDVKGLPGTIAGGLVFSSVMLLAGGRRRVLGRQKARAFVFSFLLIYVAILAAAAQPEIIKHIGITIILLAFFTGVLLLPWGTVDALLIGAFTVINFMWVYRMADVYVSEEIFVLNIVLLVLASFVAAVVKRSEGLLREKEFMDAKQLEEKNDRIAKEMELANTIHKSLIPCSMKHDLADVAVTYVPMLYMGGDYANFSFLDDDKLVFIVADMTGHGVSSALLVNRMDTEIKRLLLEKTMPGDILRSLDSFINVDYGKMGYYLSAFAGLLDFSEKKLTYSNYGHPPQMLLSRADGRITLLMPQTGLMGLGMDAGKTHSTTLPFSKGDRVILFTDGILDAKDAGGEFYENERLERFARENRNVEVEAFNEKLLKNVRDFQLGRQNDDIFLMTIQLK